MLVGNLRMHGYLVILVLDSSYMIKDRNSLVKVSKTSFVVTAYVVDLLRLKIHKLMLFVNVCIKLLLTSFVLFCIYILLTIQMKPISL